jgi:DNA-binding response OmpR family regulator
MADQVAVVVEDDPDIAHLVATTLSQAGFDTEIAESGPDALELIAEKNPSLVTLDLALPGMDGVEVCRRLREISDCYVIMLTARDTEIDRLIGLEVGADDFMNKPFSTRELRARVAAMLRRPRAGTFNGDHPGGAAEPASGQIDAGSGLIIDTVRREVHINEHLLSLTRTEFDLLAHLAHNAGVVCSRAQLISAIWDSDYAASNHMIDVHIANLRRKLREYSNARWVNTVRGVGFRFDLA